jgi:hypothetical protein
MKITEKNLPIALALYLTRSDVEQHLWNKTATWRFISGVDKRHPQRTAVCTFADAVAAFLLNEIGDYFGDWVPCSMEQIPNCNNGRIVEVFDTDIKHRTINILSKEELDIMVADGFDPIGYKK